MITKFVLTQAQLDARENFKRKLKASYGVSFASHYHDMLDQDLDELILVHGPMTEGTVETSHTVDGHLPVPGPTHAELTGNVEYPGPNPLVDPSGNPVPAFPVTTGQTPWTGAWSGNPKAIELEGGEPILEHTDLDKEVLVEQPILEPKPLDPVTQEYSETNGEAI